MECRNTFPEMPQDYERSDTEWKFARSKLWMSYFEDGDTVPPPFNLLPALKNVRNLVGCGKSLRPTESMQRKSKTQAMERHETVMKLLIRRYVTAEQRKRDEFGITEDDVMEIRQDISAMRYELIDILRNNGMKTPKVEKGESATGKKGRVMERRLLKDFQIGLVEGMESDALKTVEPKNIFSKIAKVVGRKSSGKGSKKDWNAMVRKGTLARDPIGSTSEARAKASRQSARRHILEHQKTPMASMDPEKLVDYNPMLSQVSPATRVAYAKFKINKIKAEFEKRELGAPSETSSIAGGDDKPSARDSIKSKTSESNEYVAAGAYTVPSTIASQSEAKRDFRSRTPIQEEAETGSEDILQIVTASTPTPTKSTPSTPSITVDCPTPSSSPQQPRRESLSAESAILKTPPVRASSPDVAVEIEPEQSLPSTSTGGISAPQPPPTPKHLPKPSPSKSQPGNWL